MDSQDHTALSKPHKACDACRLLKIRCALHDSGGANCSRCTRLGIQCVFSPRVRKKQRKRTDARVAVLERELQSLRSSLPGPTRSLDSGKEHTFSSAPDHSYKRDNALLLPAKSAKPTSTINQPTTGSFDNASSEGFVDPSQEPSHEQAFQLIRIYMTHCAPLYPVVYIKPQTSACQLQLSQPLLYKAILGAASLKSNPQGAVKLQAEMLDAYSKSTLSDDLDLLDLIQAILVSLTWYLPTNTSSHKRKVYELAHLAISTAVEIGLDSQSDSMADEEISEEALGSKLAKMRAFIGCYMLSQGMAMTLRRSPMVRSSESLCQCIEAIRQSREALELDDILVAKAKHFQIVEMISQDLRYNDPQRSLSVADSDVQKLIQKYRTALMEWRDNAGLILHHDAVSLMFHYTNVYLHESALYTEHDPRDFVAPFELEKVGLTRRQDSCVSAYQSTALSALLSSAHSFLDNFVSLDIATLRVLPVSIYFRLVYIAFVLTKLAMSHRGPSSHIGNVVLGKYVKADHYRRVVLAKLNEAMAQGCYPAPKFFLEQLWDLGKHWGAYLDSMSSSVIPAQPQADPASRNGDEREISSESDAAPVSMDHSTHDGFNESFEVISESWFPNSFPGAPQASYFPIPEIRTEFGNWTTADFEAWPDMMES